MKRILVPTDFSDCARYALEFACEIALKNNSKLLIIHTVEYPFGGGIDPTGASVFQSFDDDYINILKKRGRDKMAGIVSQLPIPSDEISQLVEIGHTPTLIVDAIREYSIDLVVMGTHGASGVREMFVGSNAEKIVRSAPCPVITLKKAVRLAEIKNMAFASDFNRLDKDAMAALKRMQTVLGAEIDFVRINTPNNFQRDILTKRHMHDLVVREMFLKSSINIYNDYSEEEGLLNFAEERKSDMIGMLTHGRSGMNHIMSGSIAEDVVNHINVPVWTLRIPNG
jgi:nucleotide-binding universal stress UspA family protein